MLEATSSESLGIERREPLYTLRQILVATYFGGLIGGCWLLAGNADALENYQQAKNIRFGSLVITVAFGVAALLTPDIIPSRAVPTIITAVIYYAARNIQGKIIDIHLMIGGERRTWRKVAGVSLLSLAITIALAGLPILLLSPRI